MDNIHFLGPGFGLEHGHQPAIKTEHPSTDLGGSYGAT